MDDAQDAGRLAARALALVDIPSVSRDEARCAAYVADAMPSSLQVLFHDDDALLCATPRTPGRPFVVLAGHYDTVPAQENLPGRIEDGWVVGLGATDMKGGLAVMIELARWLDAEVPERAVDVGFLFFAREELPVAESPLPAVFAACPALREADLAIVLEPTDNAIQAGCLGNVNATLSFTGRAAHSARPWTGENAIAKAVEQLRPVVAVEPREVVIEGLRFVEVLSVTRINGGVADNVVPDRVEARLNFRYAPDRTPAAAEARLRELVGEAGALEITSNSGPARVAISTPVAERLRTAGPFAVEPKQAWTPVAQFSEEGLDAVNLGPGATRYAHTRDERCEIEALLATYRALQRFVAADAAS
ncbi:MAG: succinyl-diaminopimelate desuccinylase [Thermoleophilia bacterium]